jgi:predicted dinucleotide-binding enzyme
MQTDTKKRMKVVVSSNIKRESVLIDPAIGVNGEAEDNNVIESGTSSAAIVKKIYGRR